ncbi:DUF4747 family protein [Pandoraea pnomenusa]|uniref:DUF4747 family protein n=1 Tax=Pandoraea pnomenusa TaxID=93220 RepID=UPI003340E572
MGRSRQFSASGINVRVHTQHHWSEYVSLWNSLHALKRPITHGPTALMIGDVKEVNDGSPEDGLYGYLYRFLNIDPNDPWFNIVAHKKATDKEVEEVSIPPALKPNLKEIPYFFDVKKHRFYFIRKEKDGGVAPASVHRLFEKLTAAKSVKDRFQKVDITVLTEVGAVEAMLKWPVISSLTIHVERPNPNDEEDDEAVFRRLRRRNVVSETHVYKKAPGASSVTPDADMNREAKVAANNGEVIVKGKNPQFQRDSASSTEFPMHINGQYDPNIQTLWQALISTVMAHQEK